MATPTFNIIVCDAWFVPSVHTSTPSFPCMGKVYYYEYLDVYNHMMYTQIQS